MRPDVQTIRRRRENEWAKRPDQVVVGLSTVDQVGSRLLFRGYGVSDRMAPVHAGLLGADALYLLDEVHLSQPFADTMGAIAQRWQRGSDARFRVVQMSATPGESERDAFGLEDDDRSHPVLSRRLAARKVAALVEVKVAGDERKRRQQLAAACADHTRTLLKGGAKVVAVVVNRVDTAREAWRALDASTRDCDVVLLTGRMRPLDRDRVLGGDDGILARAMTRPGRDRQRPLVLVSTQCIEAGADLDLDALVTECASLDALRQRFGRLDRRGELQESSAVILMRSDQVKPKSPDPVYGDALHETWAWLVSTGDVARLGIDEMVLPDGNALTALLSPRPRAPVLLPAHLDAWVQTSPRPAPDPDVALWLHGAARDVAEVKLVWRADLTAEALALAQTAGEEEAADALEALLAACPPSSLEALAVPLYAARSWLSQAAVAPEIDDASGAAGSDAERSRVGAQPRLAFAWRGEGSAVVGPEGLQAGDTLVVPAAYGGLSAANWDPCEKGPVTDLGDVAQLRARGRAVLRTHPEVLQVWNLDQSSRDTAPCAPQSDAVDVDEMIQIWLEGLPEATVGPWAADWTKLRAALRTKRGRVALPTAHQPREPARFVLLGRLPTLETTTEDDDSSFIEREVTLDEHCGDVERWARRFAESLGLPAHDANDLALAAWLHDVGKADPRFQRWLVNGSEVRLALLDEPLAKSKSSARDRRQREIARRDAGYPRRYRHELLSLAMLEQTSEAVAGAHDRDLVLYLVASHHGWCRPFAPAVDHPDDLPVELEHRGVRLAAGTRHRLAGLDSGVSDRFWAMVERYGWWGLAWREAILRLADHRASEEKQR